MLKKIKNILLSTLILLSASGCAFTENNNDSVSIDSITVNEISGRKAVKRKKNDKEKGEMFQYTIAYTDETDIKFTIRLNNPRRFAIDAIRMTCDDPESLILIDGEWKPIRYESDGSRVVNWAQEDPYEKSYFIRIMSEEFVNTFRVLDLRLVGHSNFQSVKEKDFNIGNNELHIYKMDRDAVNMNIIESKPKYMEFNFNINKKYTDVISNLKVNGEESNKNKTWSITESQEIKLAYNVILSDNDDYANIESNYKLDIFDFGDVIYFEDPTYFINLPMSSHIWGYGSNFSHILLEFKDLSGILTDDIELKIFHNDSKLEYEIYESVFGREINRYLVKIPDNIYLGPVINIMGYKTFLDDLRINLYDEDYYLRYTHNTEHMAGYLLVKE